MWFFSIALHDSAFQLLNSSRPPLSCVPFLGTPSVFSRWQVWTAGRLYCRALTTSEPCCFCCVTVLLKHVTDPWNLKHHGRSVVVVNPTLAYIDFLEFLYCGHIWWSPTSYNFMLRKNDPENVNCVFQSSKALHIFSSLLLSISLMLILYPILFNLLVGFSTSSLSCSF